MAMPYLKFVEPQQPLIYVVCIMTPSLSLLKSIFELSEESPSGLMFKPSPVSYADLGKGFKKMFRIPKQKIAGIKRVHNKTQHKAWRVVIYGVDVYVHRIIYMLHNNIQLTDEDIIDHKNQDGLDNSVSNLRPATNSEIACNTSARKDNKLGHRGICLHRGNRYVVQISKNKKKICIGSFKRLEDAIKARHEAEIKYHGEFASCMHT